jgi:hypothetical protein
MLADMPFRTAAARIGVFLLLLYGCSAPAGLPTEALAQGNDVCALETTGRIVAVGDVHGAYDGFVRILRAAGILDDRERWMGGNAILVQTGDVVDRGKDSRKALDLLRRLEREAPRARGRVLALVGNHEVMRMSGDVRDVSAGEFEAFHSPMSVDIRAKLRDQIVDEQRRKARAEGRNLTESELVAKFDAQTPLGLIEMVQAFGRQGEYGRWLREHHAVARVNGIVFLHGGISPRIAPLGCSGINAEIRTVLTTGWDAYLKGPMSTLAGVNDGPLWYRGLALEEEATLAPEVEKILAAMQARAIVIGHSVSDTGRIKPRFNGRVVQIDTGMLTSVYKHGRPSALEIAGDKWTAIYEDSRESLTTPVPSAAAGR